MKRCIAAVALALLAFPGGALAQDLRTEQHVSGGSLGVAPGVMPQVQAKGTNVAAPDQQASTLPANTPPADVAASDDGGFDWSDAGIGAATAVSLMGISLAGGMTIRRRHRRGSALPA
jgi:hypothetical protein